MKRVGNKGETLIEVVFSLAVLAIVVSTATVTINASSKILSSNIDGRNMIQQEVEELHLEMNLETVDTNTISYTYSDGTDTYSDSFTVEKVRVSGKTLQKYR